MYRGEGQYEQAPNRCVAIACGGARSRSPVLVAWSDESTHARNVNDSANSVNVILGDAGIPQADVLERREAETFVGDWPFRCRRSIRIVRDDVARGLRWRGIHGRAKPASPVVGRGRLGATPRTDRGRTWKLLEKVGTLNHAPEFGPVVVRTPCHSEGVAKLNMIRLTEQIPDEAAAYTYLEKLRWNGTPISAHCGSDRCYFLTPANGKSRTPRVAVSSHNGASGSAASVESSSRSRRGPSCMARTSRSVPGSSCSSRW